MHEQMRELTLQERAAMWLYHGEYSEQRRGAIEFYASLGEYEKNTVARMLDELRAAENVSLQQRMEALVNRQGEIVAFLEQVIELHDAAREQLVHTRQKLKDAALAAAQEQGEG